MPFWIALFAPFPSPLHAQEAHPPAAQAPATDAQTDDSGFTFTPRGRIDVDFGHISAPQSTGANGGFGGQLRRLRAGAVGTLNGDVSYKVDLNFSGNRVSVIDAFLSYKKGGLTITAGQHRPFQGLEELSSTVATSFIERAALTDAFGFERRIGLSAQYKTGDFLLQSGVFADNGEDLSSDNTSFDARLVYAPKAGSTQFHFGGSVHFNDLGHSQDLRYRQRPGVSWTDNRFLDTMPFSATSELGVGLEAAAIAGPLHVVAEGFRQTVNRPGALADPSFWGTSFELGFFLTKGDTRSYKDGIFTRISPAAPLGDGGIGAVQANLRYDRLDLNSQAIRGGEQASTQASLVWTPTHNTRLLINYSFISYDDAALPTRIGDTSYHVHVIGARAIVTF